MKRAFIVIAALALGLVGCAGMGGADSNGIEVITSGMHTDVKDQTYVDIRNVDDFKKYWNMAFSSESSPPAMPDVDFTKKIVLAVFIGDQPHGGYVLRVNNVSESELTVDVTVSVYIPGNRCHYTMDKVSPFTFVTIPFTTKPVNFDVKQSYRDC